MRSTTPHRWTQDDIFELSAETFSMLPRPSGAAIDAFVTLLKEYWPGASTETRDRVARSLREGRHGCGRVLSALDRLVAVDAAPRIVQRLSVTPPPLAVRPDWTAARVGTEHPAVLGAPRAPLLSSQATPLGDASAADGGSEIADDPNKGLALSMFADLMDQDCLTDMASFADEADGTDGTADGIGEPGVEGRAGEGAAHARAIMRRVLVTGERAPSIQPRAVAEALDGASDHVWALAEALHLPEPEARIVLSNVPGTLIALRALGVSAARAVRLTERWHGVESAPLLTAYRTLRLAQCMDAIADWRNLAAQGEQTANDDRAARGLSRTG